MSKGFLFEDYFGRVSSKSHKERKQIPYKTRERGFLSDLPMFKVLLPLVFGLMMSRFERPLLLLPSESLYVLLFLFLLFTRSSYFLRKYSLRWVSGFLALALWLNIGLLAGRILHESEHLSGAEACWPWKGLALLEVENLALPSPDKRTSNFHARVLHVKNLNKDPVAVPPKDSLQVKSSRAPRPNSLIDVRCTISDTLWPGNLMIAALELNEIPPPPASPGL